MRRGRQGCQLQPKGGGTTTPLLCSAWCGRERPTVLTAHKTHHFPSKEYLRSSQFFDAIGNIYQFPKVPACHIPINVCSDFAREPSKFCAFQKQKVPWMNKFLAMLRHRYGKSWGGSGALYYPLLPCSAPGIAEACHGCWGSLFHNKKKVDVHVVLQCFKWKDTSGKASVLLAL